LVGLIARFDTQKNHLGFLEAASKIHAQLPDVHFLLAGEGVDSRSNHLLTAAIAAHGLQANVHLLGRRTDIPRLMASLDVLASSSHGEAFPNVIGEAMSCAVPCVATDVGDSSSIIGNNGRVVPPGDMTALAREIVAFLTLPPQAKALLGVRSRAHILSNFEVGYVSRLYEAFYQQGRLKSCVD
jgi:glycosyltransferase involved in cell wall biosynthesis